MMFKGYCITVYYVYYHTQEVHVIMYKNVSIVVVIEMCKSREWVHKVGGLWET